MSSSAATSIVEAKKQLIVQSKAVVVAAAKIVQDVKMVAQDPSNKASAAQMFEPVHGGFHQHPYSPLCCQEWSCWRA